MQLININFDNLQFGLKLFVEANKRSIVMPNINNIRKTLVMKKLNIPEDVIIELGFDDPHYEPRHRDFEILVKISGLLTEEQQCAVMEQQGCHKTGKMAEESKDYGKKYVDKSLAERLMILSTEDKGFYPNDDGTISLITCELDDAGVARGCHCLKRDYEMEFNSFIQECSDKAASFSHFHCGCCAGHNKYHLQNKLGVKLKLKSIGVSAVKTGNGQKRTFVYEII